MIKKSDLLKKLSEMTGIEVKQLTDAITSDKEDLELELVNKHVFTEEELTERLTNHAKQSSRTFIEMAVKEQRNALIEKYGEKAKFEGKTLENLVAKTIELGQAEANVKPNEKIEELNGIINKLQRSVETVENEWIGKYNALESRHNETINSIYINGLIPDDIETNLPKSKLAALLQLDRKVKEEDGKKVFTDANGNVLRNDKTQAPLSEKEVIETWLTENNFKRKNTQGRGGANEHGQTKTSLDSIKTNEDFYKYCEDNKIPRSEWGKTLVEVQKTNKDFALS